MLMVLQVQKGWLKIIKMSTSRTNWHCSMQAAEARRCHAAIFKTTWIKLYFCSAFRCVRYKTQCLEGSACSHVNLMRACQLNLFLVNPCGCLSMASNSWSSHRAFCLSWNSNVTHFSLRSESKFNSTLGLSSAHSAWSRWGLKLL